ncbi:MAG: hypothetical protein H0T89_06675 [Deltaproteobacteria bacterium]|nr:hypothetical protein [Deltaproteobacteria bacterium]
MSDRDLAALFAACMASPDDDAPRLVWADAVGGERGELVVIQCDLARGGLSPAETATRRQRLRELLATHGAAWSELAGLARRCMFQRGFVDAVEAEGPRFLEAADALRSRAPLARSLTICGLDQHVDASEDAVGGEERTGPDTLATVDQLLTHSALGRYAGIEIADARISMVWGDTEHHRGWSELGDQVLERIAMTGSLRGLRGFGIGRGGAHTSRGLHELVGSGVLATVERLALHARETSPDAVIAMLRGAPALRALSTGWIPIAAIAPYLPPTLVELRVGDVDDAALAALAASPAAASLERLAMSTEDLVETSRFGAFPRLRSLAVSTAVITDRLAKLCRALGAFARTPMPALRELRMYESRISIDALRSIVSAFGEQLEHLDCRGHHLPPGVISEVQRGLAGELRLGPWQEDEALLEAGVNTRAPWLDAGIVTLAP